jgi:hypothetical protein
LADQQKKATLKNQNRPRGKKNTKKRYVENKNKKTKEKNLKRTLKKKKPTLIFSISTTLFLQ